MVMTTAAPATINMFDIINRKEFNITKSTWKCDATKWSRGQVTTNDAWPKQINNTKLTDHRINKTTREDENWFFRNCYM